jgi:hypothetical protein
VKRLFIKRRNAVFLKPVRCCSNTAQIPMCNHTTARHRYTRQCVTPLLSQRNLLSYSWRPVPIHSSAATRAMWLVWQCNTVTTSSPTHCARGQLRNPSRRPRISRRRRSSTADPHSITSTSRHCSSFVPMRVPPRRLRRVAYFVWRPIDNATRRLRRRLARSL